MTLVDVFCAARNCLQEDNRQTAVSTRLMTVSKEGKLRWQLCQNVARRNNKQAKEGRES